MAGYIPNAWVARLLEATAGKTAITTATVYLGLATAVPDDPLTSTLANITEVTTAGYARKVIPAFNSATTNPNQITTPTAFSFNALTADMTIPANYAFLCDVASGTAGIIRYIWETGEPLLGITGEPINIAANSLIIE